MKIYYTAINHIQISIPRCSYMFGDVILYPSFNIIRFFPFLTLHGTLNEEEGPHTNQTTMMMVLTTLKIQTDANETLFVGSSTSSNPTTDPLFIDKCDCPDTYSLPGTS
jgi:hypothetical protein